MSFHEVLYTSHLAPEMRHDTFAAICRSARLHNVESGLLGVLLFDGERFAQLLQGPTAAVQTTMARIRADARHTGIVMLRDAAIAALDCEPRWRGGFCEPQVIDALHGGGDDARERFKAALPGCDLFD